MPWLVVGGSSCGDGALGIWLALSRSHDSVAVWRVRSRRWARRGSGGVRLVVSVRRAVWGCLCIWCWGVSDGFGVDGGCYRAGSLGADAAGGSDSAVVVFRRVAAQGCWRWWRVW